MCASASKLMKLVLKLYFCSLQIALVLRKIFEIEKMLQNMYNAIINWNLANFYCWENQKGNKFLKHYSSFLVAAIILLFLLLLPLFHSLPCTKAGIPSVSQALIHSHAAPRSAHSCLQFSGPVPHSFLGDNQNQSFLRWLNIFKSLSVTWLCCSTRRHNCYIPTVSCSVIPLSDCLGN